MTAYDPSEVMMDASDGDVLELSQYVQEVEVIQKKTTLEGIVLIVQSTSPQASATYRLRSTADDDQLLFEKRDGKNWTAHCRVDAELKTDD